MAPLRVLESRRLTLVAATVELIDADLKGGSALATALGADVPANWPPDLYDRPAMQYSQQQLRDPAEQGWSFWYLLTRDSNPQLVGLCGFKGRPDAAGRVEIGYSVVSQHRNSGVASEAAARLVAWAFTHRNVQEVIAETFPHLKSSIRVMEKNGLSLVGPGAEQGVIRYAVKRPG